MNNLFGFGFDFGFDGLEDWIGLWVDRYAHGWMDRRMDCTSGFTSSSLCM